MRKLLLAILALNLTACGFEQVDEGYRGIKTRFGKVEGEALTPGLYFYNPISSTIFEMSVREEKLEINTQCFTKDNQTVTVQATVTYYPEPAEIQNIYSQFGKDWENKTIMPAVLGSIKDSIGQYIADDLVSKREVVKDASQKEMIKVLATRKITVTRLDFTNLDFEDSYERAAEAKVVAIQEAQKAKNETIKIMEEAKQKIETAKADAESMKIKTAALSQNRGLVEYEIAQKWDGKLPEIVMGGSSIPMINFDSLKSKK